MHIHHLLRLKALPLIAAAIAIEIACYLVVSPFYLIGFNPIAVKRRVGSARTCRLSKVELPCPFYRPQVRQSLRHDPEAVAQVLEYADPLGGRGSSLSSRSDGGWRR
jgi:hypothetical protein